MKLKNIMISVVAAAIVVSSLALPVFAKTDLSLEQPKYSAPVTATKSDFEYNTRNSRVFIKSYIGDDEQIIIPSYIDNLPVYAILPNAFKSSDITYIKVPETVAILSATASSESNPFSYCDSLTRIDVDEKNTTFTSVDGVVYSKDKTVLKIFPAGRSGKFLIPNGVKSIENYAFYRCYQLEEVNMYNTVTSIGDRAFDFCWGMKNIRLSDNLQTIGKLALAHCNDLTELHLPRSITSIGVDAFLGRINSNDSSKEYYLVDGIYCVSGSYASKYIKNAGLAFYKEGPTYTDVDSGITITDIDGITPANTELKVETKLLSSINEDFSKTNYTDAFVYELSIFANGKELAPTGNFKVCFDGVSEKLIPTATKVFTSRVGDVNEEYIKPSSNTATVTTDALGTFIVLLTNNFSKSGDVNGDGALTIADARLALLASAKIVDLTPEQIKACDVVATGADKGKITTADARQLLRSVVSL